MSSNYKPDIHKATRFLTSTITGWIDVFTKDNLKAMIVDCLRKNKWHMSCIIVTLGQINNKISWFSGNYQIYINMFG